jgi:iron(III) transport system permease protein
MAGVSIAPTLARARVRGRRRDPMPGTLLAVVIAASAVICALGAVVVWLSLSNALPGVAEHRFTFANYVKVFTSAETYTVLWNTAWFSAAAVVVACCFGIPAAWLVERTDLPGKTALFTAMTVGLLIPNFTVAMGWIFLMQPRIGILNKWVMGWLGLDEPPFDIATIFGMGWVEGLALAPLTFVMTAALFRLMDPALEEAASASGANARQTFLRVTLPLIWPGVLAAMLYTFVIGFAAFDVPAIIGWSKRIFTFATQMYLFVTPAVELPRYGPAAAFGAAMIPLAIGMSVWYGRVQRNAQRYQVVTGRGYRPRRIKLGRWVWAAWGFLALYLFLGQAIPVLALVWSSLLNFFRPPSLAALEHVSLANFQSLPWVLVKEGMRNTALLVIATPTVVVALSLAFSWIVVRSKFRWRAVFDFFAFLPHAVPGVIFAIGALLVALFVLRDTIPIYNTIWLILATYVIVRLSYGTRVMNGALSQIHKELEEAGRVAGASTWQVFRTVIVPILTPALLYAWLWIALLSYRELTLATLLAGEDNATMAVVVWGLWLSGGLGRASALTVLILLLLTPLLALYWFLSRRLNAMARV